MWFLVILKNPSDSKHLQIEEVIDSLHLKHTRMRSEMPFFCGFTCESFAGKKVTYVNKIWGQFSVKMRHFIAEPRSLGDV